MNSDEQRLAVDDLRCPSGPARADNAVLIGVLLPTANGMQIVPTDRPIAVTPELIDLAAPRDPDELFRFATPCAAAACPHFTEDHRCQIAAGSVERLDEVVDDLPRCAIRKYCRWFRQEGSPICRRCPQIVRQPMDPDADMVAIVNHDAVTSVGSST